MTSLQTSFEHDLERWVSLVYERRAGVAAMRVEAHVARILDGERRWLTPLVAGVVVGVGSIPFLGPLGLVGSLVLLYVGAFSSGFITMQRAERAERAVDPRGEAVAGALKAWETRPDLGVEERARLVRIMNLARGASLPGVRPLLIAEVREALAEEPLARWPFLGDVADLLRSDAAALA